MKKYIFLMFIFVLASFSFIWAGGTKEKKKEVISLNAIGVNDPYWGELSKLVGDFKENTGITVVMEGVGYDEAYNNATLDLSSHTGNYDIIAVDTPWNPEWANVEFLVDLGPYIDRDRKEFRSKDIIALSAGKWKGIQTAVPISPYIQILYYRKDLFDKYGLDVPKTWDDLYQVGKKLTRDTDGDGKIDLWGFAFANARGTAITQFWELQYISSGGTFWRDATTGDFTPLLDQPLAQRVTERFKKFLEIAPPDNITYDWFDQENAFAQGKVAMIAWWDVFSGDFENPEKSVIMGKWAAADSPSEDGTLGPWVAPWMWGINRDSPKKDEAWEFIKWVLSDEIQKKLAATGATPPCRFSLLKDPGFLAVAPTGKALNAELKKGSLSWPYVIKSAKIEEEIMGVRLNQMMLGELSINEALDLMQKDILDVVKQ